MDSMAFGMGMCCLQMTFQCCNIEEARMFYDQLAVLAPIMLALSANAPIFRGFLADQVRFCFFFKKKKQFKKKHKNSIIN